MHPPIDACSTHTCCRATDSTAPSNIPRNIFSFPMVYVPQTTSSRLLVFFSVTTLLTMKETTSSCRGKQYWGSQYVVSRYSVLREGRDCSEGQSNIDVWARKSPRCGIREGGKFEKEESKVEGSGNRTASGCCLHTTHAHYRYLNTQKR